MKQLVLFALVFGFFFPKAISQSTGTPLPDSAQLENVFQHFFQENTLAVTLELDFKQLLRLKEGNVYQPAKFRYVDKAGLAREIAVEVKPKGHSRRKICDIPPIKVKFPKEFLSANRLQMLQPLEMVVICNKEYGYEQFVLREYMAYRLYNILTNNSLRVQLLKLNFQEAGTNKPMVEGFAFFIEPEEELAQRLHGKVAQPRRLSSKGLNTKVFDVFCLFQFMIGNTDWYVYNRHNVVTLAVQGDSLFTPIPFDFDYSGIVGTPYAVPPSRLQLPDATTRYFLGLCRRPEEWAPTLQLFQDKKADLLGFCQQFPPLSRESRKYTVGYLEEFFQVLDNPKNVQKMIVEHCGAAFIK